jgi:hypothetical protein
LGLVVADEQANAMLDLEAAEINIEGECKQRVKGEISGLPKETSAEIQDIGHRGSG